MNGARFARLHVCTFARCTLHVCTFARLHGGAPRYGVGHPYHFAVQCSHESSRALRPVSRTPECGIGAAHSSAGSQASAAIFIAGVSSRLPINEAYRSFYDLLASIVITVRSFYDLVTSSVITAVANGLVYEQAQQRAEALAELDRAKTAFFSNISHEFWTPRISDATNFGRL